MPSATTWCSVTISAAPPSASAVTRVADHSGRSAGSLRTMVSGGHGEQRGFVARGRAGDRVDVVADVEAGVVDPDRSPAAERGADQALP